jgi:hypothetical protein
MELVVNANLLSYGFALTEEANDLSTNSTANHFSDSMQMPRILMPNTFWSIYLNLCGLAMLLLALPAKEIAKLSAVIKFLYYYRLSSTYKGCIGIGSGYNRRNPMVRLPVS